MNPIEMLAKILPVFYPDLTFEVDPPMATPAGFWYLDVRRGPDVILGVVELTRGGNLGVSVYDAESYGCYKPDFSTRDLTKAVAYLVNVVLKDVPPRNNPIQEVPDDAGAAAEPGQ